MKDNPSTCKIVIFAPAYTGKRTLMLSYVEGAKPELNQLHNHREWMTSHLQKTITVCGKEVIVDLWTSNAVENFEMNQFDRGKVQTTVKDYPTLFKNADAVICLFDPKTPPSTGYG